MDYIDKAKFWSENPCFDIETQKEAKKLLKYQNRDLCKDSFGSILEFGTGGLRGIMGVGTNRVNIVMIAPKNCRQIGLRELKFLTSQTRH